MSAMLVSPRQVDRAVSALALAVPIVAGVILRDEFGRVEPQKAALLGRMICELNGRSVMSRYQGRVPVPEGFGSDYVFQGRAIYTNQAARPSHVERVALFKALHFFIYQCEEDETMNDPLLAELREAFSTLARELVAELPTYLAAPWG